MTASTFRPEHFKIFTHITLPCFWCLMLAKSFWTGHIKAILEHSKPMRLKSPSSQLQQTQKTKKNAVSLLFWDMQVASETKCCRRIRKRNCFPESLKPLSDQEGSPTFLSLPSHQMTWPVWDEVKFCCASTCDKGVLVKCSMPTRIDTHSAAYRSFPNMMWHCESLWIVLNLIQVLFGFTLSGDVPATYRAFSNCSMIHRTLWYCQAPTDESHQSCGRLYFADLCGISMSQQYLLEYSHMKCSDIQYRMIHLYNLHKFTAIWRQTLNWPNHKCISSGHTWTEMYRVHRNAASFLCCIASEWMLATHRRWAPISHSEWWTVCSCPQQCEAMQPVMELQLHIENSNIHENSQCCCVFIFIHSPFCFPLFSIFKYV